jgi:hypothetical protein
MKPVPEAATASGIARSASITKKVRCRSAETAMPQLRAPAFVRLVEQLAGDLLLPEEFEQLTTGDLSTRQRTHI